MILFISIFVAGSLNYIAVILVRNIYKRYKIEGIGSIKGWKKVKNSNNKDAITKFKRARRLQLLAMLIFVTGIIFEFFIKF